MTKEDALKFAKDNAGKKIELHYECNLYPTWGDDDIFVYDTNKYKNLLELMNMIKTHYIHGIKLIK